MSSKRKLTRFKTITNGDMSTASITSAVTNIGNWDNIGLQFVWTGSPVGTFAVQVSIDHAQDQFGNVTNAGTWVPLTLSPSPITSLGSPIYIDMTQLSAPWIRVVYTKTSGSGTLQTYISAKTMGG